jgi:hypothetical protein
MSSLEDMPVTLLDLLSNTVILRQTAPYIPLQTLLSLSSANRSIRRIITSQPEPWRHLDLTGVKSAIVNSSPIDVGGVTWRMERMVGQGHVYKNDQRSDTLANPSTHYFRMVGRTNGYRGDQNI